MANGGRRQDKRKNRRTEGGRQMRYIGIEVERAEV